MIFGKALAGITTLDDIDILISNTTSALVDATGSPRPLLIELRLAM